MLVLWVCSGSLSQKKEKKEKKKTVVFSASFDPSSALTNQITFWFHHPGQTLKVMERWSKQVWTQPGWNSQLQPKKLGEQDRPWSFF